MTAHVLDSQGTELVKGQKRVEGANLEECS